MPRTPLPCLDCRQTQILRGGLQRLYGIVLQPTFGRGHEQAVPVYPRRLVTRAEHVGRHPKRELCLAPGFLT
jgi:hypothetical protein